MNQFTFSHRVFPHFLGIGLLGVVVNTAALILLREQFGLPLLAASLLAGEIALVHNYLLHRIWTFKRGRVLFRHVLLFHATALTTLSLSSLLLVSMAQVARLVSIVPDTRLAYPLANVLALLLASSFNYLLIARWVWLELPVRNSSGISLQRAAQVTRALLLPGTAVSMAAVMAVTAVALSLVWVVGATPGGWAAVAVLLLGAVLVIRPGIATRQVAIMVLATAVGVSSVDYLTWRLEMIDWASWWVSIPLFVAELFGALHTLGLQYTVWPRPKPRIDAQENPTRRPIYIFIPTVDEGAAILEPTIRGALAARDCYLASYPHGHVTIVVCNDGLVAKSPNWRAVVALTEKLGVECITRKVGGGAKAGNIEHARQQIGATGNALVVIFDADQIAEPNFLLKTVPPFADPTIGWVQTGQYYSNLGNPVARWANDQQALFYQILCSGKAAQNAAFICGTNVVLRAAALDEIGGLPQDTVTEDFVASIELHQRWRSIFLTHVLARGLGPMDLKSYFAQQRRWATGTLGVLRTHWRQIFLPWRGRLRMGQRVQYALACTHYLCGMRDLIYLVAPLVFLLTGMPAVRGSTLTAFLWHFLPYWVLSQIAFWHVAWRKTSLRGIVIGFGSFPVLIGSLLTVILGRRVGFAVTAKQRSATQVWRHLLPHLLGALACMAALSLVVWTGAVPSPVLVSILWVVYSLLMLGGICWLGLADQHAAHDSRRSLERVTRRLWVHNQRPATFVLRPALAGVTAVLVGYIITGPRLFVSPPVHFAPQQEAGRPYLGISLPVELLESRPPQLERQLGYSFAIVGRTQVISDTFDRVWADELLEHDERPWITLLFGLPGHPTLDSSLPAIANGVHDDALRRWAQAIRAYGKPVYLTILPHVDRNWSLSSAVTNGGIPQDVPRAWQHVKAIFSAAGASNVAWAWAPADPANDQAYAPPPATIDIAVLSMISFPNDSWGDPAKALSAVSARHPHTPIFMEVSVAGQPERKARWLRQVGDAIGASQNVYALLYHEGAPAEHASAAEHQTWSLASDEPTLRAMQETVARAALQTSVGMAPARR